MSIVLFESAFLKNSAIGAPTEILDGKCCWILKILNIQMTDLLIVLEMVELCCLWTTNIKKIGLCEFYFNLLPFNVLFLLGPI